MEWNLNINQFMGSARSETPVLGTGTMHEHTSVHMYKTERTQKTIHTHKQSQKWNRCRKNIGHPIYNVTFTAAGLCSTLSPWLWHTVYHSVMSQLTALLNHYTSDSRRGHQAKKRAHIQQTFFWVQARLYLWMPQMQDGASQHLYL